MRVEPSLQLRANNVGEEIREKKKDDREENGY